MVGEYATDLAKKGTVNGPSEFSFLLELGVEFLAWEKGHTISGR